MILKHPTLRKCHFRVVLIIASGILFYTTSGCTKVSPVSANLIDADLTVLENRLDNCETFILELARSECRYCKEFESECLQTPLSTSVPYLRVDLSQIDVADIEDRLSINVKTVPMVIWIQDGKAENSFPVNYPYERKQLFQDWVDDNISYFATQN